MHQTSKSSKTSLLHQSSTLQHQDQASNNTLSHWQCEFAKALIECSCRLLNDSPLSKQSILAMWQAVTFRSSQICDEKHTRLHNKQDFCILSFPITLFTTHCNIMNPHISKMSKMMNCHLSDKLRLMIVSRGGVTDFRNTRDSLMTHKCDCSSATTLDTKNCLFVIMSSQPKKCDCQVDTGQLFSVKPRHQASHILTINNYSAVLQSHF